MTKYDKLVKLCKEEGGHPELIRDTDGAIKSVCCRFGKIEMGLHEFCSLVKKIAPRYRDEYSTYPIWPIREEICGKTGMSIDEFDKKLGACVKHGYLTVDFRKPIGEEYDRERFAEIGGRWYYIIRKFLK